MRKKYFMCEVTRAENPGNVSRIGDVGNDKTEVIKRFEKNGYTVISIKETEPEI